MDIQFWIEIIISILSGIAVLIPLLVKLNESITAAVREKNWNGVMKVLMQLMTCAEELYEDGADKKEWVMGQIEELSGTLNYDMNYEVISDMIDSICDASRKIN